MPLATTSSCSPKRDIDFYCNPEKMQRRHFFIVNFKNLPACTISSSTAPWVKQLFKWYLFACTFYFPRRILSIMLPLESFPSIISIYWHSLTYTPISQLHVSNLIRKCFHVFATLFALDSHLFPFNFSEHSHRQELVCERCPQVHRHKNLPACPLLNLIHP